MHPIIGGSMAVLIISYLKLFTVIYVIVNLFIYLIHCIVK